jgi:hypothetical protein
MPMAWSGILFAVQILKDWVVTSSAWPIDLRKVPTDCTRVLTERVWVGLLPAVSFLAAWLRIWRGCEGSLIAIDCLTASARTSNG